MYTPRWMCPWSSARWWSWRWLPGLVAVGLVLGPEPRAGPLRRLELRVLRIDPAHVARAPGRGVGQVDAVPAQAPGERHHLLLLLRAGPSGLAAVCPVLPAGLLG